MIPQDIIEQVQAASDIVDVVSSYFPMKRAGRNFKALCPFHNEKTPSFMVSAEKQIWHCFGCGAGGSVFSFVMQYERVSFPEAVRILGRKAGITVPERAAPEEGSGVRKADLYRVNEFARAWFQNRLARDPAGKAVREHLKKRGMDDEMVRTFGIGYAPDSWDALLKAARAKKYADRLLLALGLVMKKEESGRVYDRFRKRIMVPINDVSGRVIAFSGRVWGEGSPKYMNSPESPLFHKSRSLYGLDLSKRAIVDSGFAIVVEGYFDYYALYRAGIRNVVASQGTAFTPDHARILKRYADEVVMSLDSDAAGQMAAAAHGRDALLSFLQSGFRVRVLVLPEGDDPDSFIEREGGAAFEKLVSAAPDFYDFMIERVLRTRDVTTAHGKAKAAAEFIEALAPAPDAVYREAYLRAFSDRAGISVQALLAEMGKRRGRRPGRERPETGRTPEKAKAPPPACEKELVRLMLDDGEAARLIAGEISPRDFSHGHLRRVAEAVFSMLEGGSWGDTAQLMARLSDEESARIVSALLTAESPAVDRVRLARDCIAAVLKRNSRERSRRIREEITRKERAGASPDEILSLQKKLMREKEELLKIG